MCLNGEPWLQAWRGRSQGTKGSASLSTLILTAAEWHGPRSHRSGGSMHLPHPIPDWPCGSHASPQPGVGLLVVSSLYREKSTGSPGPGCSLKITVAGGGYPKRLRDRRGLNLFSKLTMSTDCWVRGGVRERLL